MEIPQSIATQAIAESRSSSPHSDLLDLLLSLEQVPLDGFLNNPRSPEVDRVGHPIHTLVNGALFSHMRTDAERVASLAPVIATARQYLLNGIETSTVRPILIFLMVNTYLHLPLSSLLTPEEINDGKLAALSDVIAAIYGNGIGNFQPTPTTHPPAAALIQTYNDGLAEQNLSKTYQLINLVERDHRPILSYLVANLMAFLYEANPTHSLALLGGSNDPMALASYLFYFPRHLLNQMAADTRVQDKWVNFEILRRLVNPDNRPYDTADIDTFKKVLARIQTTDFHFLKQGVRYFHRSKLVNAAVGLLLAENTGAVIAEVFSECYPVNAYHNDSAARNILANEFAAPASDAQVNELLSVIYRLWKAFMDQAINTGTTHTKELVLTDYADLVPAYYIQVTSDEDFKGEMWLLINQLRQIDSRWVQSHMQQKSTYNIFHSMLFLMSFAYKAKVLRDPSLEEAYVALLRHPVQLSRYANDELKRQFQEATSNIQWTNA